jgi:hypothetical protein
VQVRVLFLALKWFRGVSPIAGYGYLETTFNLSRILSQKNRLGGSAARMNVLIGSRRVTVSEQVADTEKVP